MRSAYRPPQPPLYTSHPQGQHFDPPFPLLSLVMSASNLFTVPSPISAILSTCLSHRPALRLQTSLCLGHPLFGAPQPLSSERPTIPGTRVVRACCTDGCKFH